MPIEQSEMRKMCYNGEAGLEKRCLSLGKEQRTLNWNMSL